MRTLKVGKPAQLTLLLTYTAVILLLTLAFEGRDSGVRTNLQPFESVERLMLRVQGGEYFSSRVLLIFLGIAGNLVLFAPWAFLTFKFLHGPERSSLRTHLDVLLFGLLLSLGVEALQLFLPTRAADVDDVLWNLLGTITGSLLAQLGQEVRIEWA
jgi:glycopeptide antibiotics resistance protein